ncbi:unnamed protein product [Pleuronectes platessa]|uniref:Uncharacterized protein n=1 Tax=Pleuronectes platessa TaxID=8262 RepID=A0A9N7VP82_PLEPL|nr:unnamed protein product [Pleuronectes platessa]
MFLLCCCHRPLRTRVALELMGLPLGCFSPQMGTAGGHPPPRAEGVKPSPLPHQASASSPCSCLPVPLHRCRGCAFSLLHSTALPPNRRGSERGSSRRGWTTVVSTVRLVSALREQRAKGGCYTEAKRQRPA